MTAQVINVEDTFLNASGAAADPGREFDGGLSRAEAEALALEDTVERWLPQHPHRPATHGGAAHIAER
jgi:hypothetical protein